MTIRPDSQISSPIKIEMLINRLQDLRASITQKHVKQRLHLAAPDQVDQQIIKDLRLLHIKADLDNIEQLDSLITELKGWLKRTPVLHFTFSTPTTQALQAAIIDWLHAQIDPNVLVDFRVDRQVAAGFLLRTKNQMYDFTANQLLWDSRGQIAELVKHV